MVAAGLGIIYLLPRLTKAVPSPLVCIVVLTTLAIPSELDVRTVGDLGELPADLPAFLLPDGAVQLSRRCASSCPMRLSTRRGRPAGIADDRADRR